MGILGAMDLQLSAIMLILILIFTLVWEDLTQRLEMAVADSEHYGAMLGKVYRELMILGFISFTVVISNEFSLMSHSKLIPFEFAHLLIFFVSMFYVVITVIAAERLAITHRQWQRMANLNANVLADELEKLVNTRKPSGWSPLWSAINPTLRVNMWEDCEWKVLRLLFLREFDIGTEFDYSKYVNHKLSTKLGHSLHIHPSTWGLVMVVSLVFYVYKVIVPSEPLDDGHRRRLAAGPSEIKYCEVEVSPGDKEEGRWQCDYSDVQTNVSVGGNQTADICVLSFNEYEKEYVHVKATDIVTPLAVAWCLCISQGYVMYQLKSAIHRIMETKGCKSAVEMPKFLRRLNAEVSMRSLLPHVPMFEGGGDEFINCVLDNLKLSFFGTQDVISKKGDRGHSMYFICSGCADVVCDGTILGSLVPGDYAGEMAILLDQPRSASIVARNRCAVFELDRDHLLQIGEEFPAAVQRMIDFAVKRRAAAQQGRWDEQRSLRDEHETVIEDHARKLSELQRQKENEEADTARASIKSKIMSVEGLGDLGAVGKDLAKDVVQSLKANPISSVKGFVKKSAHTVGIPGTGAGSHSVHGAHGGKHLEKMVGAEQIMSHDRNHTCEEISEITMLLNCFAMGFYVLRMVPYLIPNMGGGLFLKILTHILLVTPCTLVSLWMAPVTTKYSCLLDNVLFKDSDTIAEVYHTMTRLIALKNNIKDQLNKVALSLANDVGLDASQSSFDTIAEMMFENIASKSKRGGLRVSYVQLRKALSTFGVYMPRREYKQLMEFVDPDRDGWIELNEWKSFLTSSDDQIMGDEWQEWKREKAARKRLSAELVRKALSLSGFVGREVTVQELMDKIFEKMDSNKDGLLSVSEIRSGLDFFGLQTTEDDKQTIQHFVNTMGTETENGKELTISQWKEFIREHEMELPTQGNSWAAEHPEEITVLEGPTSPRAKDESLASDALDGATFEQENRSTDSAAVCSGDSFDNPLSSKQRTNPDVEV